MNVIVGAITSSLLLTPANLRLRCNAAVPFMQAIANFDFVYFAIFFSNKLTNFPEGDSHDVLMHSFTY